MDADKDAICELMRRGLDDYIVDSDYPGVVESYARAEALWGKWCDPERIACPTCGGYGGWLEDGDGFYESDECPDCYGTGKVSPPSPPPPPTPPKPRRRIVNGGIYQGLYRVFAMEGEYDFIQFTGLTFDEAYQAAQKWVAEQTTPAYPEQP